MPPGRHSPRTAGDEKADYIEGRNRGVKRKARPRLKSSPEFKV